MTYRRRVKSDTWHFVTRCRWWPRRQFVEKPGKPKSGEFCNECLAKAKR
jgi:hypothetical protein